MKNKTCACGRGEPITSPRAETIYKPGHHTRVAYREGRAPNQYEPSPEEIPSGICECGCGLETGIAQSSHRRKRHFKGYPLPRLPGHSIKKGRIRRTFARMTEEERQAVIQRWKHLGVTGCAKKSGKYGGGYILVLVRNHPQANKSGYVLEHRLVAEEKLGRLLQPNETVHHKNGKRDDNRPENLEIWHTNHGKGVRGKDAPHCPTCTCYQNKTSLI